MTSSIVYSRTTSSLHPPSLRVNVVVHRVKKQYPIQVRTLWWWGRQGSWSSANEDTLEERMQRHQKILRHRYSRALRRRATWDRDNSPPSWSWSGPGRLLARRWGCKPLSTSDFLQARVREDETGIPAHDQPWENHQREFEAFKTRVDEALKQDPYGVVFGRRLRNHPATGESPWNSFSNLFGFQSSQTRNTETVKPAGSPRRIKIDDLDAAQPVADAKSVPGHNPFGNKVPLEIKGRSSEEYVYDPISGRKVLKPIEKQAEIVQPKKPFLQALFSEHGIEEKPPGPSGEKSKLSNKSQDRSKFENSRSHEYQKLRAATLGTSIDTTVVFAPKHESKQDTVEKVQRSVRNTPEPDDDAPLFSGTTYAGRDQSLKRSQTSVIRTSSNWLQQEGFKQADSSAPPSQTSSTKTPTSGRLQPSLDRVQLRHQNDSASTSRLQPAMDRMQSPKPNEVYQKRPAPLHILTKQEKAVPIQTEKDLENDKREDLDLLRASDVRAATKSARTTKQDIEQAKITARSKLEADFAGRQKAAEITSDVDAARATVRSSRTSSSIDSVRNHMQRYPDGIVARTMKSMGIFNDNFKKYERPEKSSIDLTEKIELKQEALDKLPSIFKNSKSKPVSAMKSEPTPEAEQVERSRAEMTKAIMTAKRKAIDQWQTESLQVQQLADSIREVYEANTVPQAEGATISTAKDVAIQPPQAKSLATVHPLKLATVKPGVPTYPVIEYHINVFEPKLIKLRDDAKSSQKAIHGMQAELDGVKSRIQESVSIGQQPKLDTSKNTTTSTIELVCSPSVSTNAPQQLAGMDTLDKSRKGTQATANENIIQVTPPATTPSASDSAEFTSPFVILTYNKGSGEVDMTQLNSLMGSSDVTEKVNPIVLMGRLNYPAAFVPRFVELEKAGYQLTSGGGDMLIFHKDNQSKVESEVDKIKTKALNEIKSIKDDIKQLRDKIAEEEIRNQPQPFVAPAVPEYKKAATVLDEIPSDTPIPGPAAPTAPATPGQEKKKFNKGTKVKRQEQVFSGTIRPNNSSFPQGNSAGNKKRRGILSRFFRTLTIVVNSVVGLGVITYVVGVVAEGKSVQAQYEKGTVEGNDVGPRKKVVMPATRPGIYSTESSRD